LAELLVFPISYSAKFAATKELSSGYRGKFVYRRYSTKRIAGADCVMLGSLGRVQISWRNYYFEGIQSYHGYGILGETWKVVLKTVISR
jgi:hypothetical protein